MKKLIIIFLVLAACTNGEVSEVPESTSSTQITTTSTSTSTTTLTSSTSTTTSPVSIVEVDPTISITCEPSTTEDGEYLSFKGQ